MLGNLTKDDVLQNGHTIAVPESAVSLFKGNIEQPVGGFDPTLQKILLKEITPYTERPSERLQPINFDEEFSAFKTKFGNR